MRILSETSIQYLKGVGLARKKLFERLSVETVEDLLYLFPRRYEDRRNFVPFSKLKVGEWQAVTGKILGGGSRRSWYTKKHVVEVVLEDQTGHLTCVWFNQPFLASYFKSGIQLVCYGKPEVYKNRLQMVSPQWEIIDEEDEEKLGLGRIVPVYPLTQGITQWFLRKTIKLCLDHYLSQIVDELPVALRNKYRFYNMKRSLRQIHFPDTFDDQENAMRRISFEEFYFFQVSVIQRRMSIVQRDGFAHRITDVRALQFIDGFSFSLTGAQKRVIQEIRRDMEKQTPMLRLLQGDVGSGKTLVALFGCVMAVENGFQACLMAPTEILAHQHYTNILRMIQAGYIQNMRVGVLTSSVSLSEKAQLRGKIEQGEIDLVVGTHALFSKEVIFKNLSFVVIDEQHKFGVRQRALLGQKGRNPDILIMTATPIPRTLCITLYGDLDLSVLDEMPPGRGTIKTVLYDHEQFEEVYAIVRRHLKDGRQVYVVCPIIEESEKLDLKAARVMFRLFQKEVFKDFRVGLVHGQLKPQESREIMEKFQNRELDILVATTVLEVGIDVPNAAVMVVEHAERFGLSQLHQLRGRIGRGKDDGLCILVADTQNEEGQRCLDESQRRLKAFLSTNDGFKIAQYDLEIRGPGRYFGRHQHGLNELKVANPLTQLDILELARKEAMALIEDDPRLGKEQNHRTLEIIRSRYPSYLMDVEAG